MTRSYRNSEPAPPIMAGSPVPPEWRLPASGWDQPPWNRWAFQHIREIVPTVEVRRGATAWEMPSRPEEIGAIGFTTSDGRASTWAAMLDETYADAVLIWLGGRVIAESYHNAMTPARPHLAMSVSKSVVGAVCGGLIAEGLLDPAAPVTAVVPELAATAWDGATLGHLLDMTSGVRFNEDYGDPNSDVAAIDIAAGWRPAPAGGAPAPACVWDLVLRCTEREAPHGARFAYRSIETDVLGFVMERAIGMRLADLVSARLWAPMGAEQDGYFSVDRAGFALADGGFNACLRDFARFGRLLLEDGARDGVQVIPRAWIEDIRRGAHGLFNADSTATFANGLYRNQFWIEDRTRPAHLSLGIFGQHIYVDPERGLVAVKLSSWPDALGAERRHLKDWLAAVKAVAAAFGA
ncbi:serine hydrolase domain-containing protein [Albidovulum sp.]